VSAQNLRRCVLETLAQFLSAPHARSCIFLAGDFLLARSAAPAAASRNGAKPERPRFGMEDGMKRSLCLAAALLLSLSLVPAVHAQTVQITQGTQVWLTLLNNLSTHVTHEGDAFTAVISQPVYLGNQMLLPAGAKVHGVVTNVEPPRHFALFRSGASMSLTFTSIEIDSRLLPARLSILGVYKDTGDGGKIRRDLNEVEGVSVEEKRDVKGYVRDATIGVGGGTAVGAVFSHVVRGFGIGLIGSAAYVVTKRGKDVELPAQTGLLVRLDNPVWVPAPATAATVTGTLK
jgi:hypothetical protein